ncbi:MAG: hypothetical protein M4579_002151 [Chaenotheca gracillima]|nr:MAG: hypothetical protein M4579_002151 [Chaenotheca gracillima]
MSFAVVLEGMTLVAYVTVLLGGRQKRETGWKVLGFLLVLTGAVQCAGMAIMAFLYNTDERFIGWRLDSSWILCTISWSTLVISAVGVVSSAYILPSEGDYELIPSNE